MIVLPHGPFAGRFRLWKWHETCLHRAASRQPPLRCSSLSAEDIAVPFECLEAFNHCWGIFLTSQGIGQRHDVLRATVDVIRDYTRPCSPDIAWRIKDVDEANVDVLETQVSLICCKQLAQLCFVVEGWLKDSIERHRSFWQINDAREKLGSLFVLGHGYWKVL
jgi:hypothetical protein